jgi:hypothetical protein
VRWLNLYRRTCQIDPVLEKRLLRCAVAPHELHAPHSAHRSDTSFPPQQSRRRRSRTGASYQRTPYRRARLSSGA